jgi:hypothetical protein
MKKLPGERFDSQPGGVPRFTPYNPGARSHTAVFLKTHEHKGDFKEHLVQFALRRVARSFTDCSKPFAVSTLLTSSCALTFWICAACSFIVGARAIIPDFSSTIVFSCFSTLRSVTESGSLGTRMKS